MGCDTGGPGRGVPHCCEFPVELVVSKDTGLGGEQGCMPAWAAYPACGVEKHRFGLVAGQVVCSKMRPQLRVLHILSSAWSPEWLRLVAKYSK